MWLQNFTLGFNSSTTSQLAFFILGILDLMGLGTYHIWGV